MYITNRCAKHPQHAKHTHSRGSGGMPPRKILKIRSQESEFGEISANKITYNLTEVSSLLASKIV